MKCCVVRGLNGRPWCAFSCAALVFGLLALAPGAPQAVASEGLYLLGNDALQIGRADSGTASPRSAYWTLMNPAALVELDRRADLTLYGVRENIVVNPDGIISNKRNGSLSADGEVAIPAGGVVWPLAGGEKGVLGMGAYILGGGEITYEAPRSLPGRLLFGGRDRKLALQHLELVGGYGYRLDNGWALGAGVQGSLTRLRTDQLTLRMRPAIADYAWDEAVGIGFNLGIYKRWDKWSVGAMYKSRQWADEFDDYEDLLYDSLDYPHMFRVGLAYRPADRLEFTLDYEYQMWSEATPFSEPVLESGLRWNDIHAIKGGAEWQVNDAWTLMAGVSWSEPAIDEDHLFANLFVPTIIEWHFTAGVSYHINERHHMHVMYMRSEENRMTNSGQGDIISRLGKGTEAIVSADSVAIGYSYMF
ncbi:MAG: OmpP1/FadL family transporter [Candidatus Hydrogenedentota bacterium]